jgi:hypothetical protein
MIRKKMYNGNVNRRTVARRAFFFPEASPAAATPFAGKAAAGDAWLKNPGLLNKF